MTPLAMKIAAELTKRFNDEGKLIAAGFAAFHALVIPDDAPEIQVSEMRTAFFAGAQHLFGSIMTNLSEGSEPTGEDDKRMMLIDRELAEWAESFTLSRQPTEGSS